MKTLVVLASTALFAVIAIRAGASAEAPTDPSMPRPSIALVPAERPSPVTPQIREAVSKAGTTRVHIVIAGGEKLRPGTTEKEIQGLETRMEVLTRAFGARVEAAGGRVVHRGRYTADVTAVVSTHVLEALERMPEVRAVYLPTLFRPNLAEGIQVIKASPRLHGLGYTGVGYTAVVIDTGVNWTEPSLGGCALPGTSCRVKAAISECSLTSDAMDHHGHGTAVAGIIAANYGTMKGVAPDANLVSLKVLGAASEQCDPESWTPVQRALEWVIANASAYNVKVVNMSIGDGGNYAPGDTQCDLSETSPGLSTLINQITNLGIAVTVASGNDGSHTGIDYPACVPPAVAVGAVYDQTGIAPDPGAVLLCADTYPVSQDQLICYTDRAANLDLMAPSWNCDTTGWPGFNGTSAAAPYVAGGFLVLKPITGTATVDQVLQSMKNHGVPVTDPLTGLTYPRLDLEGATLDYDLDGDGRIGTMDNCPFITNVNQADGDGDGVGTACDNCPSEYNPAQNYVGNPIVTVLAPNGGETLTVGNNTTLRWRASDTCGGVQHLNIYLSRGGVNGTYEPLFLDTVNDRSEPWTVTGPVIFGPNAFLKVEAIDPAGNTGIDKSDAGFRIQGTGCGPCQVSYCSGPGVRCNWTNSCGGGGCCSYSCVNDATCTGTDPCPPNACNLCN